MMTIYEITVLVGAIVAGAYALQSIWICSRPDRVGEALRSWLSRGDRREKRRINA